jgi:hypothetical protein
MIHASTSKHPPHLFKIGHTRTFNGVQYTLISYTRGRNPRPKYRSAEGMVLVVRERKSK